MRIPWQKSMACILGVIFIGMITTLAGCSSPPAEKTAKLGEAVNLTPGQSVSITGETLKISFVEVINDSRCPTGVTCIWEGEVSCKIEITYQGSPTSLVLSQRGSGASTAAFNGYDLPFEVQPYPQAGKTIDKQDYRLALTVNKKSAT